jgi:hypothetical protein
MQDDYVGGLIAVLAIVYILEIPPQRSLILPSGLCFFLINLHVSSAPVPIARSMALSDRTTIVYSRQHSTVLLPVQYAVPSACIMWEYM